MELASFYARLFETGEAILRDRPEASATPDEETAGLLRERFLQIRRELAGPLIDFDLPAAWSAARFTSLACWFLLSRDEPESELDRLLVKLPTPRTPGQHLSTDLTLRYVITLHRRSEALHRNDPLTVRLREVLRDCPLTGVMAGELEPPTGDLSFGGHPGLQMRYAERLMTAVKPGWQPTDGPTRPVTEWVFQQAGRELEEEAR